MQKKLIAGALLICACVLAVFCENFSISIDTQQPRTGYTSHMLQEESLSIQDPCDGGLTVLGVRETILALRTGIRRQCGRLSCFMEKNPVNFQCFYPISQKTILKVCFIIISYFYIQLLIVYHSDGKKRNPFYFLSYNHN